MDMSFNCLNEKFIVLLLNKLIKGFEAEHEMDNKINLTERGTNEHDIFFEHFNNGFSEENDSIRKALMDITRVTINASCCAYSNLLNNEITEPKLISHIKQTNHDLSVANCFNIKHILYLLEVIKIVFTIKSNISDKIMVSICGVSDDFIFSEFFSDQLHESYPIEKEALMKITRVVINESCYAYGNLIERRSS
jgi:hypothetical protein